MKYLAMICVFLCIAAFAAPASVCQGAEEQGENAPPAFLGRAAKADSFATKGGELDVLEAVRVALSANPDLALNRLDISGARGALRSTQGEFDVKLEAGSSYDQSHTPTPPSQTNIVTPPNLRTDSTSLNMGLSKKFRTGVEANTSVEANHYRMAPSPYEPYANAKVVFGVTLPLMKGLGEKATGAAEMAAKKDVESSLWQSKHKAAETVRDVAQAYWSYLAARRQYDQAVEAKKRSEALLQDTRELIKGGQQAAADIYQAKAQLSDKVIKVGQARQAIVSARHSLGVAMGLTAESIENLPWPDSDFPRLSRMGLDMAGRDLRGFLDLALQQRADYLAAGLSEDSLRILAEQSRLNLKPQFDAFLKVGYSGAKEGGGQGGDMADAFAENVGGADAQLGLTYYFPIQNSDARGQLAQALASLRKQEVTTRDLARKIRAKVNESYSQLVQGFDEVEQSRVLVQMYTKSVEVEERKSRLGESTLIDVINTQDRLYEAWLTFIQSQLDLANDLIDFRFQTGSLIQYSGEIGTVDKNRLFTLPAAGAQ